MNMLDGITDESTVSTVISELEELNTEETAQNVGAAIYVLKNELAPLGAAEVKRTILYEVRFTMPEGLLYRIRGDWKRLSKSGLGTVLREEIGALWSWLCGRDEEHFRDRCDQYFWKEMVPVIGAGFGDLGDALLNTINEAIINYAEYSFRPRALRRRVHVHLFKTEGDLAYTIIKPSGSLIKSFDPLALKRRQGSRRPLKRGWGHTLLMERALFLSFDQEPRRRGMMIIVGPD